MESDEGAGCWFPDVETWKRHGEGVEMSRWWPRPSWPRPLEPRARSLVVVVVVVGMGVGVDGVSYGIYKSMRVGWRGMLRWVDEKYEALAGWSDFLTTVVIVQDLRDGFRVPISEGNVAGIRRRVLALVRK